jgi:serine/threonine protein kinase
LNSEQWLDLQERASQLEISLGADPEVIDLYRFLPPPGASHRLTVLHELIKTCLEHLYRHHRGQLLEEFLRCYPELGKPDDLPVALIYEEFRIRAKFSTRPALKEYRSRFPRQFDELRMLASREFPEQPTRAGPRAAGETLSAITLPPDPPPAQNPSAAPETVKPPPSSGTFQGGSTLQLTGGEGYRLVERIGKGEFGEVYRALAPGGVVVALKRIFRPMSDEMCQRELKALKKISEIRHPFLLQTHNFQANGDHLIIVMELADGSLVDRFRECKDAGLPGIPAGELLHYFTEAAEALDFLRKEKMAHRDIKPANLLHVKGHAKVADFGIARQQESSVDQTLNFAGTPSYMAPEVWRREISVHSDQYSFAATWYEMRTGSRVFPGTSIPEVALQHMSGTPDMSKVPEAEQKVLLRALAKEPNERFPSCAEFVQALRETIEPRPVKEEPAKGRLTGPRLVSLLAAVLFAVVGYRLYLSGFATTPEKDDTNVKLDTVTQKPYDWLPVGWTPASDKETIIKDRKQRLFYRQIKRNFGNQTVVMAVVPQRDNEEPPTFYVMRDKVWNDLFKVFRDDPRSKAIRSEFGSRPGCSRLAAIDENEWTGGAKGSAGPNRPMRDLGVDGRGNVPVFRVTPFEAACVAQWMDGKLPSVDQYRRAACISDDPPPAVFNKVEGPTDLPLNPTDGPWPVDRWGRDEIGEGCRQLVSNGKEYTRTLYLTRGELPLKEAFSTPLVSVVGWSYLSGKPPTVRELKEQKDAVECNAVGEFQSSFRVVLEEK